jgi:hypothetical protein
MFIYIYIYIKLFIIVFFLYLVGDACIIFMRVIIMFKKTLKKEKIQIGWQYI